MEKSGSCPLSRHQLKWPSPFDPAKTSLVSNGRNNIMTTISETERKMDIHPKMVEDIFLWAMSVQGSADRVSKVLRLHALTEYYLDRLLALHLPNSEVVTCDSRFGYHHKRVLVESQRYLPAGVLESLKRLSALRNKCAHSLYPEISSADIEHMAEPIRTEYELTLADHAADRMERDEMHAFAWALFSEITLRIGPLEIVLHEAPRNA